MTRGEIWTVGGASDYAGKPRPAVILQADHFAGTSSITMCGFTTDPTDAPLFRLRIEPSTENGLRTVSWLMIDKITTISKQKLGARIGRMRDDELVRVNRAVLVFLGLAG